MTTSTLPPQSDEIIASDNGGGQDFAPAPTGPHPSVCCDVIDLGMWESEWKGKKKQVRKVRVAFQIPELRDDKKRFVVSRMFTLSLSEKANLRKFLENWRGVPFTPEQLAGFNLVQLIGAPALIQVSHNKKGDKTYANIDTVMKLPRGMEKLSVTDYVRVKDREKQAAAPNDGDDFGGPIEDDDDLPF